MSERYRPTKKHATRDSVPRGGWFSNSDARLFVVDFRRKVQLAGPGGPVLHPGQRKLMLGVRAFSLHPHYLTLTTLPDGHPRRRGPFPGLQEVP